MHAANPSRVAIIEAHESLQERNRVTRMPVGHIHFNLATFVVDGDQTLCTGLRWNQRGRELGLRLHRHATAGTDRAALERIDRERAVISELNSRSTDMRRIEWALGFADPGVAGECELHRESS